MNLTIASNEADSLAAAAVEQHHAQLSGALTQLVNAVRQAAEHGDEAGTRRAAASLVDWCETELLPHARAEESTLYAAAHDRAEGRLLVDGMVREHAVILELVRKIAGAATVVAAISAAYALEVVLSNHVEKENTLVLPLLVSSSDVSVATLLDGMHDLVGAHSSRHEGSTSHGGDHHTCSCGESDGAGYPELDARDIPHAIRHATIFGALDAVRVGSGLVLVAPHDPLPLLAQLERRSPGHFTVDYLQRGPEAWRLAFVRQAG